VTHTHTHPGGLPWSRDRPVTPIYICATFNIHKKQTFVPQTGFEPAIPASERPQTYTLHNAATG